MFAQALNDLFTDSNLGTNAIWRPGGIDPGTPVRVIVRRPDRIGEFGETRIVAGSTVFEIRIAEAPTLAEGDTIEVDGEFHVVQGEPMRDAVCLVWTAEARPA